MSRRKHVTNGLLTQEVEAPTENQRIVQVVGPRGGNLVEVSFPTGTTTLVYLPSKFNKKLWVKRGGYLIIEEGLAASSSQADLQDNPSTSNNTASAGKVTGNIIAILYDEHVRQLKKLPGVWPSEFASDKQSPGIAADEDEQETSKGRGSQDGGSQGGEYSEEDDGLPALERNTNRKVITHYVSSSEEEDD